MGCPGMAIPGQTDSYVPICQSILVHHSNCGPSRDCPGMTIPICQSIPVHKITAASWDCPGMAVYTGYLCQIIPVHHSNYGPRDCPSMAVPRPLLCQSILVHRSTVDLLGLSQLINSWLSLHSQSISHFSLPPVVFSTRLLWHIPCTCTCILPSRDGPGMSVVTMVYWDTLTYYTVYMYTVIPGCSQDVHSYCCVLGYSDICRVHVYCHPGMVLGCT